MMNWRWREPSCLQIMYFRGKTCGYARRKAAAIVQAQPEDYMEVFEVLSPVSGNWHGLC